MIRVKRVAEPLTFDARVRQPGRLAIYEMAGKTPRPGRPVGRPFKQIVKRLQDIPATKFPSYWTRALDDLMDSYNQICAYSCFRIHRVTGARSADHLAPKSRNWRQVYEWKNYRLACSRLNARKREFGDVLDPFSIRDGWFQLELVGFQVVPNPKLAKSVQRAVLDTINRLGLDDFRREREHDAELYWAGQISLQVLTSESPFVAKELRRQSRLLPGDR
ncbi:MAG TPA: hypothetical protein VN843_21650 [Anaerolineales bacterium]|nr:hypothetical protein [Anaerolineales bacterium]